MLAILVLTFAPLIGTAQVASPVGLWTTIDEASGHARALVRIVEKSGELEGTIVKIYPEPGESDHPSCTECTDTRHGQPVIGMTFLTGLKRSEERLEWSDGSILDPKNGKVYRSAVTLSEDGRKLKVRGFIGVAFLGRTQTWVRAEPED